jgi:hypothetical protein
MKNLVLGVIFSLFVTAGSIASVASGLNLPDEKKKKCCKSEKSDKKQCKADGKEKKCCDSKSESKDCKKEEKKTEGQ